MIKNQILSIIILISLLLSGCVNTIETDVVDYPRATDFSADAIDNGYNNFQNGGTLAYYDHTLYFVSFVHENTYSINNDGCESIFNNSDSLDRRIKFPKIYQTENRLFIISLNSNLEDEIYEYDITKKVLSKSNDELSNQEFYCSTNLIVEKQYVVDDNYANEYTLLKVQYKNRNSYEIKWVDQFTIHQEIIYYTFKNALYRNDPSKGDANERLCEFDCNVEKILVDDNCCYCYGTISPSEFGSDEIPVLYRLSFVDGRIKKLFDKRITSMNLIDSTIYFSTNDGIYSGDAKSCTKISSILTDGIYIVDEKWIYLLEMGTGNLYRITHDGSITEQIEIDVN